MRALKQFIEVANRQSISKAADHLYISQPALSRAIRQLEDSYGVELFSRNGNGVVLNSYGTALYGSAVRAVHALDEAQEEIDLLKGCAKASIRIATGDLWGLVILPEVIRRFHRVQPDVMVNVSVVDDTSRHEGLRNGIFDIVFGTPWPKYTGMFTPEFEPLVRQGAYVYCHESHDLAGQKNVQEEDMVGCHWISFGFDEDRVVRRPSVSRRDYAVRADMLMHAVPILQGSSMLVSASSGFQSFLGTFGIVRIGVDAHGLVSASGPIYGPRALDKHDVRNFLKVTRECVPECVLSDWPTDLAPENRAPT
ncbi:LysR family transcriptional regulator [Rhodobacteraceae bacterium]|nr:LysR family transcriptional regulator [Paracoccaceae bacterium]